MGRSRPDEPAAERLHAVVVPDMDVMRERKVLNAKEILRYEIESLSIGLPSHKRVLSYDVWNDDLPRTTTRKLKRFEIEKRVLSGSAPAVAGASMDESVDAAAESAVPAALTEEEQAWLADAHVAKALEVITDAARNKQNIRPGANIELERGVDSMERVELLTHLEQMCGVEVPDEVSHKIYTVRELVEAVRPAGGATVAGERGDPWARLLAADAIETDDPHLRELTRPKPVSGFIGFLLMKKVYLLAKLFLRFRVRGLENLPAEGPYLLCPNHQSYLDAFLLVAALPHRVMRNIFFVGASEYFATPLAAWFARKVNLVPVDPDTNLVRAMQAGAYGLRLGKMLILFPEGERSIDGHIKKFKKGAPILSTHLKAPIVPIALEGIYDVMPRGRGFRWRSLIPGMSRTWMSVGSPITPPDPLPAGSAFSQAEAYYTAAAERLRAAVLQLWQSLRGTREMQSSSAD